MKVLLVNKFYYMRGGAERSFFETQRVLQDGGHEVIPFAMQDERNRLTPYARYFVDKVEFNQAHSLRESIAIVPRVIYFRQARKRLEGLLRKERVDLAHVHNIAHQISPSILDSLRKFSIPVVQTLHDYKLICPTYSLLAKGQVCERCHGGRYYHAVVQRCNKNSLTASLLNAVEMYVHRALRLYSRGVDLFIAPSHFLERKLFQDGIKKKSLYYLANAIDTDRYSPRFGGERYCVYFGRLSPEKGLFTLMSSFVTLQGLRLLIIGDGLQRRELQDFVEQKKVRNVEFLGALYGEDLKKVVRNSSFVVLPSECYENCPFTVLESFAMGKPVIGSNIGGIPELITPGKEGLLFRPGDVDDLKIKLIQLASDAENLVRMGKDARNKVEKYYDRRSYYRHLMEAYKRVLCDRRASC